MNKDIERQRITIIEEASLAIKAAITRGSLDMLHKSLVKTQCNTIIKDTKKKLEELEVGKDLIEDIIKALKSNFLRWYNQMVLQLEKVSKSDSSGIVTETLKAMKNVAYKKKQGGFTIASAGGKIGMDQVQITNLRELMTIYDEGAAGRYVDYVGKIKEAMVDIQDQLASNTLSLYDAKGRKKSIRNMAEIQTRYDLINEDLSKLKDKGAKFVVATAHANASERCSWWQGKIFKIDLDIATRKMGQYPGVKPTQTILGYIDGKPYYSLKQACENGFLSYNCQHRVIAYYKGVHVPTYNLIEIKKKRDITQKQRYLENKIRQQKSKQVLAISPEERKKAQLESKRLQAEYRSFCEVNNVPRYDWRCRVTEVERNFSPRLNGGYVSEEIDTETIENQYRIFYEEHKLQLQKKIKNGTITVEEVSNPLLYEENHKVRNIYHNDILNLREELKNMDSDIEFKAKYAFDKRNEIRNNARELMVDIKAKIFLKVVMDKNSTFEEFINNKMSRKKIDREEAFVDTIESSTKSNDFFDKMFSKKRGE